MLLLLLCLTAMCVAGCVAVCRDCGWHCRSGSLCGWRQVPGEGTVVGDRHWLFISPLLLLTLFTVYYHSLLLLLAFFTVITGNELGGIVGRCSILPLILVVPYDLSCCGTYKHIRV